MEFTSGGHGMTNVFVDPEVAVALNLFRESFSNHNVVNVCNKVLIIDCY
jgi:hypothetical protein